MGTGKVTPTKVTTSLSTLDHKIDSESSDADNNSKELPVLGITVAAGLILLPLLACLTMNLIARRCPNSALGRKLNAFRAANALTEEQM